MNSSPALTDWGRAHGRPSFVATLRSEPSDFQVVENLGWELSGDGERDYLWVEKEGNNAVGYPSGCAAKGALQRAVFGSAPVSYWFSF
ncbi:MAG: hypothetical protein RI942_1665 [Pseudomonadota bacterium]